jgi:hypothetical protein
LSGFWVYITFTAQNSNFLVQLNLNLAEYHVPVLQFSTVTLPFVLPGWAVTVIIWSCVAAAGVVGAFFGVKYIRKRRGY